MELRDGRFYMKRIHTTFTHVMTYIRIMMLLIFSLFFVMIVPFMGLDTQDFLVENLNYLGFLYAILMGFLMSIAIQRRRSLDEFISQELHGIRRMYHLALHLTKEQPQLAEWLNKLKEDMEGYMSMFREVSFHVYERGNDLFRGVTYTVYSLPSLKIMYNVDLYRALLNASAKTTEARQNIRSKKNQYIGYFQWTVILVITFTFAWILASAMPTTANAQIVTAVIIFNILLVLDLLYEYDRFNDKKLRLLADLYANNLINVENYNQKKSKNPKR
jgi:hypothetical protein